MLETERSRTHLEDRWGTSGGCYKCPNVGIQIRGRLCGKDVGTRHSQWETGQPACYLERNHGGTGSLYWENFEAETQGGQRLSRRIVAEENLFTEERRENTTAKSCWQVREKLLTRKNLWNRISLIPEDAEKAAEREREKGRQRRQGWSRDEIMMEQDPIPCKNWETIQLVAAWANSNKSTQSTNPSTSHHAIHQNDQLGIWSAKC